MLITGSFLSGFFLVVKLRNGVRSWLLNGDSIKVDCPLSGKGKTPISKEEHDEGCNKRWLDHDKASERRWVHNKNMADKDREMILAEIDHLQKGQEKMGITVEKIFDRLDKIK